MQFFICSYALSMVTCYACKSIPELENAIMLVREIRDSRTFPVFKLTVLIILKNIRVGEKVIVSAEEVLKYTIFLVDADKLYDVALGLYDFDLVTMVASKTQKVIIIYTINIMTQ